MLADPGRLKLGERLARWLASREGEIDPRSHDQIEQHVRLHIEPHAGPLPLSQLRAAHVQELFATLKAGGVSGAMPAKVMTTLRTALKDAVRLNLLAVNPAAAVRRPRDGAGKEEIRPWDAAQARRFLDASRHDRLHALYVLALDSGMRQGELFGLHWPEVDFAASSVRVTRSLQYRAGELRLKEPKNKPSRRIGLPAAAMCVLEAHREAMRKAGRDVDAGPVFTDTGGGFLRQPNVWRRSFLPLVKAAKLPPARFHDMRHTHATLLLSNGVNVKAVAARLGHSSPTITLNTYAHWMLEMDEQVLGVVGRLMYCGPIVPPLSHGGFVGGEGI